MENWSPTLVTSCKLGYWRVARLTCKIATKLNRSWTVKCLQESRKMGEMFIHHHFLRAPIIEKFVFFCFKCFFLFNHPSLGWITPYILIGLVYRVAERSNGLTTPAETCCFHPEAAKNKTPNYKPKNCQTFQNAARCTTKNELVWWIVLVS